MSINVQQHEISREAEAAALGRQFESLHDTRVVEIDELMILSIPKGRELKSVKPFLDEYREKPERRKGTVRAMDAASFVALVNRFAGPGSVVFANPDRTAPAFTAVFDYNPAGPTGTDWLEHRAAFTPKLSNEWVAWLGHNGAFLSVEAFATHIEDRVLDLIVPEFDSPRLRDFAALVQGKWASPSDLVALSRGLQVNVDTIVKQAITLNTGEISVQYEESHKDGTGSPISVPNLFQIAIPVFYGGASYRISVRLRYRAKDGRITWKYELVRPDLVFDDALAEIVQKVETETGLPVYVGAPER